MNKREMIHELVDRILDVEEQSEKGVSFEYLNQIGFQCSFKERPEAWSERIGDTIYLYSGSPWDLGEQFIKALVAIEKVKNIPDVEPKVSLTLSADKARELGLIA